MRFVNLYMRTAALASLMLAACACQTAQKPVALLPPGKAPALKAAAQAPPATVIASPEGMPPQTEEAPAEKPVAAAVDAPAPAAQAPDPIADLIAKVEKEYQAGLDNYHAGKAEDAKQNFDNALNALLGSNFDVRSDERLQKEFDHVVQGVNQLYPGGTAAESDGQQEAQQKSEPAPIDETNGLTPAADAGTKAKAEAEVKNTHSDLPLMMTDQVAGYIAYFSGHGRGVFERAYARSGRYHDMIVSTFKQEGLPQDLIYLAQAESGFHPHAVSRVGARGIWQFMAGRGSGYGLHHNMWVDDRQDPEKSTRAAARHLKDLYNQFGDWYLAMAAYNSGPGTVQAAVKRTGYADFWELYRRNVLPKETRNYVPIILAVTIMTKNLSQYGFEDVSMDDPVGYDKVSISYPVDLRLVAECVDATPAQLQELNPSLLRMTTPKDGKFELHLPAGTKDRYQSAIAAIPPDMRLWWRYHKVQPGDTLASIARSYRLTVKSIEAANHMNGDELQTSAGLVIPLAPSKHPQDTATYARRITRYHVRAGDTVQTVAENFGVSPKMLRRWNGLHSDSLHGRKVLALHLPVSPGSEPVSTASSRKKPSSARKSTELASIGVSSHKLAKSEDEAGVDQASVLHHTVKSGETLYSIASAYKTTVAALKRNNGNIATLRPGMILVVQPAR